MPCLGYVVDPKHRRVENNDEAYMGSNFIFDPANYKLYSRADAKKNSPNALKFYTKTCIQILAEDIFATMNNMELEPAETFDNNASLLFQFESDEDGLVTGRVDLYEDDLGRKDTILVQFERLFGGNSKFFREKIEEMASKMDWLRNVEDVEAA